MDRMSFIDMWARKVREGDAWREEHRQFIDAQIEQANSFYLRLLRQPGGKEKVAKLTGASFTYLDSLMEE